MGGRQGKMLAVVALKLGMAAPREFLPAHPLVLLTCTGP